MVPASRSPAPCLARSRRAAILGLAIVVAAGCALRASAQDAPATAADPVADEDALARFSALGLRQKVLVIRTLERGIAALDAPAVARIAAFRLDPDTLPPAPAAPPIHGAEIFAAEEHAAGRAPTRAVVPETDTAHRDVARRFWRAPFLPDLRREVDYDHATGRIVAGVPLGYDDLFANALAGYAPGSDHAVAAILAALDTDPALRRLGAWFAHAYCDLDGRAFPPITLYDAWYAGEIVDVPDVDAIPFAWQVLGERNHRSPLSGPPRDRLYAAIQAAALRYRIHRSACEAAAAAAVRAEPDMDPMYARLVPRFHYLWQKHGDDPAQLAKLLAATDRDALLADIDARIVEPGGEAFAQREARRRELAAMQEAIRAVALDALARAAER